MRRQRPVLHPGGLVLPLARRTLVRAWLVIAGLLVAVHGEREDGSPQDRLRRGVCLVPENADHPAII